MLSQASIEQKHEYLMSQAYEESLKGRFIAPPNPWVGCVIVKHGEIIGRGYHKGPGTDHAEVMALKEAKTDAIGSTVYVTLEPCAHAENTSRCTDVLIQAGVKKVVIGVLDPDSRVRGRGIAKLEQAGIEVEVGTLDEKIKLSLRPYLHQRETGLPYCILKAAISMDGKIAARNGSSIWITGQEARRDVHLMRAHSQAILIGTTTALEDQPKLTVRHVRIEGLKPPLRILLDSKGKVEPKGPLFDLSLAPTMVVTSEFASSERINQWMNVGCEVLKVPLNEQKDGLDFKYLLQVLGKRGILQLLVEGGSKVFSSLIKDHCVNRLVLYMGGCLLGAEGVSLFSKLKLESIDDAIRMHLKDITRLGQDVRLDYVF